ncbi:MAG: helicase-exonuclease AddAB subunit AddA [Ignavibacteriaceae bacterium]
MRRILTDSQLAALDPDKHISLTANAGSGKTFVLSTRYLNIILESNIRLRNIAAITFTDKAAGELYRKIAEEIDSRLKNENNIKLKKKLEDIRAQLVSANISTIHSFCTDILKEFPVEAGIDANFTPIDARVSDELTELVIEEVIKHAFSNSQESEDIKYLIRIFGSKNNLSKEAANLIKNRKNVLIIKENIYDGKSEEQIAGFFRNQFYNYAEKIFLKDITLKHISKINERVLSIHRDNEVAIRINTLVEELENSVSANDKISKLLNIFEIMMLKKGQTIAKQGYLGGKIRDGLEEEINYLESLYQDISEISLDNYMEKIEQELAHFGNILLRLFDKIYQKYERKKSELGYLDYEDILLYTQRILSKKEVQNYLSDKYRYLMIDEYQDTNEIQYNIFLPILDYLKKGNLFVVGDEKQSIYMFRDAELEVFMRTKTEIGSIQGKDALMSLPHSFRMTPVPAAFINHLFKKLFEDPDPLFNEVEYSEIICARNSELRGGVEFLIDKSKLEENFPSEPELVARRIISIVKADYTGANYNWKDIAILVRKRSAFKELENMFVKYNIPFSVVGGTGFYQKQVVYDILNYFSFLADPGNDTALVGLLRSPFFNLSDSKIFEISALNGANFLDKLNKYAEKDDASAQVYSLLQDYLSLVTGHQPSFMLRKILSETPYISVISARANGPQELANLEKLINLTINFFAAGFKTLYDYISFLSDAIAGIEDESQAAVSDETNSVKMMTLHQAKGLEFPVVFLYNSHIESRKSAVISKQITIDKNFGLLTKLPPDNDPSENYLSAPILSISDYIQGKKEYAELKRLLYVGMTRAQDFLFISAVAEKNKNFKKGSFMGLFNSVLIPDWFAPELRISENLKLLRLKDNKYESAQIEIILEIPFTSDIEKQPLTGVEKDSEKIPEIINVGEINDSIKGEIISATKVACYNQCPLKYYLTYETGFIRLMNLIKENEVNKMSASHNYFPQGSEPEEYRISAEENGEQEINFSTIMGSVIHKLLQNEVQPGISDSSIEIEIKNHLSQAEVDTDFLNKITQEITELLSAYFSSDIYRYITSFKNFRNEYEVYLKHNNFFLFGIVDKVIFSDDRIIIVDYKTDNIKVNEIEERSKSYLIQLKFYCYILSILFRKVYNFELRLIFLRHPQKEILFNINRDEISQLADEINLIVDKIHKRKFPKNLSHCPECIFSINKKCIAESEIGEYEKTNNKYKRSFNN